MRSPTIVPSRVDAAGAVVVTKSDATVRTMALARPHRSVRPVVPTLLLLDPLPQLQPPPPLPLSQPLLRWWKKCSPNQLLSLKCRPVAPAAVVRLLPDQRLLRRC